MDNGFVKLKDKKFSVLLALSNEEQERGLMYVEPPVPNMAFIYGQPRINKFWMKNTKAPLDIIFAFNGKIVSICSGEPYSTRVIGDDKFSDLVVEFPAGTCNSYGIAPGDEIELECSDSSLMKIFMLKNGFQI